MSMKHASKDVDRLIVEEISQERTERQLSFREMGDAMGVTGQAVQCWLSGETKIGTDTLMLIARYGQKSNRPWVRALALRCINHRYPDVLKVLCSIQSNGNGQHAP